MTFWDIIEFLHPEMLRESSAISHVLIGLLKFNKLLPRELKKAAEN